MYAAHRPAFLLCWVLRLCEGWDINRQPHQVLPPNRPQNPGVPHPSRLCEGWDVRSLSAQLFFFTDQQGLSFRPDPFTS
jgi:hypothetical protein